MELILIGYMGSGKSTLGKLLDGFMGKKYYDLDLFIKEKEKKSIQEIFSQRKEAYFREKEKEYLTYFLTHYKHYILSVGGGTPCFYNNIHLMKEFAKVFYLKVDPIELKRRLLVEKEQRPILSLIPKENLMNFIKNQLIQREPFYSQAHYQISCSKRSTIALTSEISDIFLKRKDDSF